VGDQRVRVGALDVDRLELAVTAEPQALRFGRYGSLEAVPAAGADEATLLTHDAHTADPSYAFALSRLDDSGFAHTPIGVFRQVQRPSYDELMSAQIEAAREQQGDGDLAALLAGSDTWRVG
jgi:2-oxoglutarate ferredoxin oxidoreductase subunit beta